MREIKFRAWDTKLKRMYEPFDLYWKAHQHNPPEEFLMSDTANWSPHAIFLQYTGLKDKNGKEIYEGDMFQEYYFNNVAKDWLPTNFISTVCFKQDIAGYILESPINRNLTSFEAKYGEVIGNIWENPELLETKGVNQ